MLNKKVLDILLKPTKIEKQQLEMYAFQNDISPAYFDKQAGKINSVSPVLNQYFFHNREIYISKHNRYAAYPTHSHQFLELNYMLRGEADEIVNDQPLHLNTGDLLLIDVGTTHSIGYLDSNDLLMNILFRDRDISLDLISQLHSSRSVFYQFLLNRRLGHHNSSPFLLFKKQNTSSLTDTLDMIINEYYLNAEFFDDVINNLIKVLIIQMVRSYPNLDHQILDKQGSLVMLRIYNASATHLKKKTHSG